MKRKRSLGATELLVASLAVAFGLATACGGDDSASGGGGSGGTAGMGGTSGKGGSAGKGGNAGGTAAGAPTMSEGGVAGDTSTGAGPSTGMGDSGAGGEAAVIDASLVFPAYLPVTFPKENPDSDAKDMLGKILFWDEQVGSDKTMACGTCHRTGPAGGSDPRAISNASAFRNPGDDGMFGTADDIHGSQGIRYCTSGDADTVVYAAVPAGDGNTLFGTNHQVTSRKAPSYLDAWFAQNIFWDGRATSEFDDPVTGMPVIAMGGALESQASGPPMNHGEMACAGRTWASLMTRLGKVVPLNLARDIPTAMKNAIAAANNSYTNLFTAAFPDAAAAITPAHFAEAIATHERHLTSDQTPWDRYNQYLNDPKTGDAHALTPNQIQGLSLFVNSAQCVACHRPPMFTDGVFHNLGFVKENDLGTSAIAGHTGDPQHQVKTATLRNVGLREAQGLFHYGYGPGASLENVLATYNNPPNVSDPSIKDATAANAIKKLNLSPEDIANIVDFLRNGLTDPRVKNAEFPFDRPTLSTE